VLVAEAPKTVETETVDVFLAEILFAIDRSALLASAPVETQSGVGLISVFANVPTHGFAASKLT
jgi:hypothetical protein